MSNEIKTVMFVDDEKFILRSLRRLFKNENYNSIFMNSGKEALEYLEENSIDLIVSDIRMPNMDGYELLSKVKEKYPKVLRVALSGFTESRTIYKLIERNIAKIYLFKPWDNNELKKNIHRILEFEDTLTDNKILELINNLDSIPSLPKLYQDLTAMLDKDASIEDVGKMIEKDQAISSKVLRLANSAFYGRKTGDISQAIMSIGLNNLKNLVLASTFFKPSEDEIAELDKLWEHSVNTNKLTLMIYDQLLGKKIPALYGSAGLLHDIGSVIFYMFFKEKYTQLNKASDESFLLDEERQEFGITHQDIGAYLLNWWELPYAYSEAAMYHHMPSDDRVVNKELVSVVHIANYYSLVHVMEDKPHYYLDAKAFSILGIKSEAVDELINDMI